MAYALVLGTKFCGFESHHQYQYGSVAKRLRHLVHTEASVGSSPTTATNIWRSICPGGQPCLENKWYQGWYGDRHLTSSPNIGESHSGDCIGLQNRRQLTFVGSSPTSPAKQLNMGGRRSRRVAAVCKTVPSGLVGSTPTPPTINNKALTAILHINSTSLLSRVLWVRVPSSDAFEVAQSEEQRQTIVIVP